RTRTHSLTTGVLVRRAVLAPAGGRRESHPHSPGSQPGLAAAWSSATVLQPGLEPGTRPSQSRVISLSPSKPPNSTLARSRTWTCSFGGSHDVPFTTRATTIQGPGRDLNPHATVGTAF